MFEETDSGAKNDRVERQKVMALWERYGLKTWIEVGRPNRPAYVLFICSIFKTIQHVRAPPVSAATSFDEARKFGPMCAVDGLQALYDLLDGDDLSPWKPIDGFAPARH